MRIPSWARNCTLSAVAVWISLLTAAPGAAADKHEDTLNPAAGDIVTATNVTELPEFMRYKTATPEFILDKKREGGYFTGIPLIGFDPEQGFNYGLAIERFQNGPRDSPYFTHAPYRRKVTIAASNSTEGSGRIVMGYDQPYLNDTPWRITAYGGWLTVDRENYFGNTARTLGPLSYPGSARVYDKIDDYYDSQEQVNNGTTYSHYNLYRRQDYIAAFNLQYDLLGGRLRPLAGFQVDYADIDDYTGKESDGGTNAPTLLLTDQQAGSIIGFDGGWNNLLRLGLTYDTRDYEPNPSRGVVAQLLAQGGINWIGTDFNYGQVTLNVRGYYPLFPEKTRLVLAGQGGYAVKFGDVPFFAQPNLGLPNAEDRQGLGGFDTMRGYVTRRYSSDVMLHINGELRWTFSEFTFLKQQLSTMVVPFVDTGRVFDDMGQTSFQDWKIAGGAGFRLVWNVATVISFDYAISSEGSLFWMEFGKQF